MNINSKVVTLLLFTIISSATINSQTSKLKNNGQEGNKFISEVWSADLGNEMYKNPVLYADYADPDVCRVGNDYYMVSSSFGNTPGLPILHSTDLVNWKIVTYAINNMIPHERFENMQHGNGVWAPTIRYHKKEFYIYFGDPDAGIYMTKAKKITDNWSPLVLVKAGKGLIDPCPLWDDNGRAYIVHGFAGSRAGMKSVLGAFEMSLDGTKALTESRLIFDGHPKHTTLEGPKIYKRNGYYYILAPAGGVKPGWQVAMRSRNIYGPYEDKIVMAQNNSEINGPHQGAWINTPDEKQDWFIHFQDLYAYGRVTHLQPMKWVNDWPVIGIDEDGDGCGTPVSTYKKPHVAKVPELATPLDTDEFNSNILGLQWQWQANTNPLWCFSNGEKGYLRLFGWQTIGDAKNLWDSPALLLQKFPAPNFKATTKLTFNPSKSGERSGLIVMGLDYAAITIDSTNDGLSLNLVNCKNAASGNNETVHFSLPIQQNSIYLRVEIKQTWFVNKENIKQPIANCYFSYSFNGIDFTTIETFFKAREGKWIGAKLGIFCQRPIQASDSGYADFDWFRISK